MTPEAIEELRRLAESIPDEFRAAYHIIEAKYPERWRGIREDRRGTWFQFAECNRLGISSAEAVCKILNALPALLSAAEALESERTLRRSLESVAIQIMRCCNERPECPFCGIDDGEHEPGEFCSALDDTLNPPPPPDSVKP